MEDPQAAISKCPILGRFPSLTRVTLGPSAVERRLLSADAPEPRCIWHHRAQQSTTKHAKVPKRTGYASPNGSENSRCVLVSGDRYTLYSSDPSTRQGALTPI